MVTEACENMIRIQIDISNFFQKEHEIANDG
jgi:hypothetical protein